MYLLLEYYIDKHLKPNTRWHYTDFRLLIVEKKKITTISTLELNQKFFLITIAK